jgi:CRISPR-associated protein Csm3
MAEVSDARALSEKIILAGTITALTGLHVGGNDAGLGIGGADKLVVRDPRTRRPYIPGSSLKGKMRSWLEKLDCAASRCAGFRIENLKLGPCACGTCPVCVVFGVPASETGSLEPGKAYAAASRVLVRDAFLTDASAKQIESWPNLDFPYAEVKTEVSIDRLTSRANPRQFERVPAGAEFEFEIALNVYAGDPGDAHINLLKRGLTLVADDTIGGQGSRGYGQVRICLTHLARITADDYAQNRAAQARAVNTLAHPEIFGGRLAGAAAA